MTNPVPHGSSGIPQTSYSAVPGYNSSSAPRRSSYASVAAGTASSQPQVLNQSNLVNSSSYSTHENSPSGQTSHQHFDAQSGTTMRNSDGNIDFYGRSNGSTPWGKGPLPSYSSQFAKLGRMHRDAESAPGISPFFVPSYLQGSRYLEHLADAHQEKIAAHKDESSVSPSNGGSLSTSSSNANLHRMAPSHRGMTYDIIENHPPAEEDELRPLPSRWNEADKFTGLEISSDGLEVRFTGPSKPHEHEAAAVRANHPMAPECGIYYYEVTVISKGKEGLIGVGFSGPKVMLSRLPGWEVDSWAYHGDDGNSFCCQSSGKSYGEKFSTSDVIGCGVNFRTRSAFFTKNGVNIGIAFKDLKSLELYPSVGMKKPGEHLRTNFGQMPFVFDIDGMMKLEKTLIEEEINAITFTPSLQPPLDETRLIQELVVQFLAHDGYVETAKAFRDEVRLESNALHNGQKAGFKDLDAEQDRDAVNRQRIRSYILAGDMEKAVKHTRAYYPNVLEANERIYFRIRCRQFVEMIRRCSDLQTGSSERQINSTNGHSGQFYNNGFDSDMDLDGQMNSADDWDKMETEDSDNSVKYQNLLQDTLEYGQELQSEFRDDKRREVQKTLEDTFSLLAYINPKTSVVAHLLEPRGRVPVAEELNSAILISLGKCSSAALERLYQQTEVLIEDLSEDGGVGAFVNVGKDFLR